MFPTWLLCDFWMSATWFLHDCHVTLIIMTQLSGDSTQFLYEWYVISGDSHMISADAAIKQIPSQQAWTTPQTANVGAAMATYKMQVCWHRYSYRLRSRSSVVATATAIEQVSSGETKPWAWELRQCNSHCCYHTTFLRTDATSLPEMSDVNQLLLLPWSKYPKSRSGLHPEVSIWLPLVPQC